MKSCLKSCIVRHNAAALTISLRLIVRLYRQAVDYFGLGYEVKDEREVTLPGYDGPVRLGYAEAVPQ